MSVIGNTALEFDDEQAMLLESRAGSAVTRVGFPRCGSAWRASTTTARSSGGRSSTGLDRYRSPETPSAAAGLDIGAAVPVLESMGRAAGYAADVEPAGGAAAAARRRRRHSTELLAALAGGAMAAVADLESEDWGGPRPCDTSIDAGGLSCAAASAW
jgi:hypothetical protein